MGAFYYEMKKKYLPLLATQAHHLCVINSMESNQGAHEPGGACIEFFVKGRAGLFEMLEDSMGGSKGERMADERAGEIRYAGLRDGRIAE